MQSVWSECTRFNEHKIAVEDHLPPNKKHTLEDKLALRSLSFHFLSNSALTESASGAITYRGRNSIAKSREIDSGAGSGLASGVEVEIELWGSEWGEVGGYSALPLNCVVQLRGSHLSLGYPFTSTSRTQFGSSIRLPAGQTLCVFLKTPMCSSSTCLACISNKLSGDGITL